MILRTDRLVLRPFARDDLEGVYTYAADAEWSRYLDPVVPFPYTRADAQAFLDRVVEPKDRHAFAIVLGGVVGSIEVRPDETARVAELGWALGRPYWGQGLMTEAVGAVVGFCFADLGLRRVYARADARNVGSWRVMEKVGMTREAELRQHRVDRYGVPHDELWYALVR